MSIRRALALAGLTGLSACGGGMSSGPTGGGVTGTDFAGTLTITSALPAGTTSCISTTTVTWSASGADRHTASLAGGDCLEFVNQDSAAHQPGSVGGTCPALSDATRLTHGQSFTTAPLDGPATCQWEDQLIPPGGGGY
jgi:hypothetical protein